MLKKRFGLMLALSLVLSLTACDGGDVTPSSSKGESSAQTASQDEKTSSQEETPLSVKTVAELKPTKIEAIPGIRNIGTVFDYSQYMVVSKGDKKGIADYDGNIILPVEHEKIQLCFEGIAVLDNGNEVIYSNDLKSLSAHNGHGLEHPILVWDTVSDSPFNIYIEPAPLNADFASKTPLAVNSVKIQETQVDGYTQYELLQIDPFYGFMKDFKLITELEFYSVHEFSDGLAAVRNDKLWGYINEKGEMAIDFQFDDISDAKVEYGQNVFEQKAPYDFSNGYAGVCRDGKWGYIDKTGNNATKFIYSAVVPAYKGKGWVCTENQNWQLVSIGTVTNHIPCALQWH